MWVCAIWRFTGSGRFWLIASSNIRRPGASSVLPFRCSTFNEFNWNWERGVFANVMDFYAWEPYVYVQSYNDVWKLTKPLLRLAKSNPTYYQLVGHLIRTSTYPLPWMLGDFTKVGY